MDAHYLFGLHIASVLADQSESFRSLADGKLHLYTDFLIFHYNR